MGPSTARRRHSLLRRPYQHLNSIVSVVIHEFGHWTVAEEVGIRPTDLRVPLTKYALLYGAERRGDLGVHKYTMFARGDEACYPVGKRYGGSYRLEKRELLVGVVEVLPAIEQRRTNLPQSRN